LLHTVLRQRSKQNSINKCRAKLIDYSNYL
jgi:hypothetical protein